MLLSFWIKTWENLHFQETVLGDSYPSNYLWYKHDTTYIAPHAVSLQGDCFSGKTTLFNVLLYLKSLIVEKINYKEADIEVSFFASGSKYSYHIKTCNKGISFEEIYKDESCIFSCERLHNKPIIQKNKYPYIYNWFSQLIFIPSLCGDYSECKIDFDSINDALLFPFGDIIYPNFPDYLGIHCDSINHNITFSANGKVSKFEITKLSKSLQKLLCLLPILYKFIFLSDSSVLVIDDIDYVANGLVKRLLIKRFADGHYAQYPKQLIAFSNIIDRNVFTKGIKIHLPSFL